MRRLLLATCVATVAFVTLLSIPVGALTSAAFRTGIIATSGTGGITCTFASGSISAGDDVVVMGTAASNTDTMSTPTDNANGGSNTYTSPTSVYTLTTVLGGYTSVAHVGALSISSQLTVSINWSASASHHAICFDVQHATSCAAGGCIDTNGPKGTGSTSVNSIGPTANFTAQQNDELILSVVETNSAITINTQTSSDTGACTSSATTTGTCTPSTLWNGGSGSASTTRDAGYYRNITGGGTVNCSWSFSGGPATAGTMCMAIKTFIPQTGTPSLMMTGVGHWLMSLVLEPWRTGRI